MTGERCQLCVEFGREDTPATVHATVEMAGKRPRYPLCDDCLADIEEYCEDIDVLVAVADQEGQA